MKKIALLLFALTLSCGRLENLNEERLKAMARADEFYAAVTRGDLEEVMGFYNDGMFREFTREEWKKDLKRKYAKLGKLQKYELTAWNFREGISTQNPGRFFILRYDAVYKNGKAIETINFFQRKGVKGLSIYGHLISSPLSASRPTPGRAPTVQNSSSK
jgi:hypothetical protein